MFKYLLKNSVTFSSPSLTEDHIKISSEKLQLHSCQKIILKYILRDYRYLKILYPCQRIMFKYLLKNFVTVKFSILLRYPLRNASYLKVLHSCQRIMFKYLLGDDCYIGSLCTLDKVVDYLQHNNAIDL